MTKSLIILLTAYLSSLGHGAIFNPPMATFQNTASLTIDVSGVKERNGKLQVGLFNSAEGFPDDAKPYRAEVLNITESNSLQIVFRDLPPGEYAVAVYHDKNGNGKLDKNLLGIPVEDYGFSNDTRGTRLSTPSFEDTKMRVEKADTKLEIEVR